MAFAARCRITTVSIAVRFGSSASSRLAAFEPGPYRANAASRFSGACASLSRPSWNAPISRTTTALTMSVMRSVPSSLPRRSLQRPSVFLSRSGPLGHLPHHLAGTAGLQGHRRNALFSGYMRVCEDRFPRWCRSFPAALVTRCWSASGDLGETTGSVAFTRVARSRPHQVGSVRHPGVGSSPNALSPR